MYDRMDTERMASILAEDVNAPELRNPLNGATRFRVWLKKLTGRK